MLWIPITVFAALAQTVRNAAQRHLVTELGTLGATLVRFLSGCPSRRCGSRSSVVTGERYPRLRSAFFAWAGRCGKPDRRNCVAAADDARAQFRRRRGLFQDRCSPGGDTVGRVAGRSAHRAHGAGGKRKAGVLLLPRRPCRPFRSLVDGFASRTAMLGIGSGAGLAMASVAYRGAALALPTPSLPDRGGVRARRRPDPANFAARGLCWCAIPPSSPVRSGHGGFPCSLDSWARPLPRLGSRRSPFSPSTSVRTLGLIEMVFSYAVSRRFFREEITGRELAGMALLVIGVLVITLA